MYIFRFFFGIIVFHRYSLHRFFFSRALHHVCGAMGLLFFVSTSSTDTGSVDERAGREWLL